MKTKLAAVILCAISFGVSAESTETQSEEDQYYEWAQGLWDSLDRQSGEISLPQADAVLNVPDGFYYLGAADSQKVLVDVWGNPPEQSTLGMLFPIESTPFDSDAWAVTIEYEEDGYVSDKDADNIDYNDLLASMQADTRASSEERVNAGYEAIDLIGWASPPYYNAQEKKLHWAKELKFGGTDENTLNYNIRVLGRKGVLVLNFIADIDQLAQIETNVPVVLALAEFDQGAQYSDFNPDMDKVAAYGLGALVAGKVIAKTGFFVMAMLFLKKFGIFIVVAVGAFAKKLFQAKAA